MLCGRWRECSVHRRRMIRWPFLAPADARAFGLLEEWMLARRQHKRTAAIGYLFMDHSA